MYGWIGEGDLRPPVPSPVICKSNELCLRLEAQTLHELSGFSS